MRRWELLSRPSRPGKPSSAAYKAKLPLTTQPGNCTVGCLSWRNEHVCPHENCMQMFIATWSWPQPGNSPNVLLWVERQRNCPYNGAERSQLCPWPGGSWLERRLDMPQSRDQSLVSHIQESANECSNKWTNKSIPLSLPRSKINQ